MQKKMRKLVISLFTMTLFFGLALSVSAAASQTGTLGGKAVKGSVSITSSGATGQTYISVEPTKASTTTVLTYSYINTLTDKVSSIKKTGIGSNVANISATMPSEKNIRSWRATASHTASYSGQKWTANTSIYY